MGIFFCTCLRYVKSGVGSNHTQKGWRCRDNMPDYWNLSSRDILDNALPHQLGSLGLSQGADGVIDLTFNRLTKASLPVMLMFLADHPLTAIRLKGNNMWYQVSNKPGQC